MSYEIEAQSRELDAVLEDLRETLRRITNFNNAEDREQKLGYCRQLEQQARTVRAAFALELKALEDGDQKNFYQQQLKEKTRQYRALSAELEARTTELNKELLTAEAEADNQDDGGPNDNLLTIQKAAAQGDKLQDKSLAAVGRMKGLVADAEKIGIDTAAKMDAQIQQLGGIASGLDDIEYNTRRAKQTVSTIAKNAAHDRCLQDRKSVV